MYESPPLYNLQVSDLCLKNMSGGQFMAQSDIPKGTTGYQGLGLGHMSDVPVAAFDPIFWLHHACVSTRSRGYLADNQFSNIDRFMAIWQSLNPQCWFDHPNPGPTQGAKGEIATDKPLPPPDPLPTDPLLPFHFAEGEPGKNLYSSNMTRDWTAMKYQYDDLIIPDIPTGSPEYISALRAHIDKLYPSTRKILEPGLGSKERFSDYIINIIYDRYALNGLAYSILFFLGQPPTELSDYRHHENFVGCVFTFSSPVDDAEGSPRCENCARQRDATVLSKAQVPITLHLLRKLIPPQRASDGSFQMPVGGHQVGAVLDDTERIEQVLGHSDSGLQWVFVALGGQVLDKTNFKNTLVTVLKGEGRNIDSLRDSDGTSPAYGNYKRLLNPTKDKRQGYGNDFGLSDDLIMDDE